MAPALMAALNKSGMQRNFPRAVVYGPAKFQGLGVKDPYLTQGIEKIRAIIDTPLLKSGTFDRITAVVEQFYVQVGTSAGLETDPKLFAKAVDDDTWISHVWKFLREQNISVLPATGQPKLRRAGDRFVMDVAKTIFRSPSEIARVNRCRLHLQVMTVADIVTGDGERILPKAWDGELDEERPVYYEWPHQPSPPPRDWQLWRRLLGQMAKPGAPRVLQNPLQEWTDDESGSWRWFFSRQENTLFRRRETGDFDLYRPQGRRLRYQLLTYRRVQFAIRLELPVDAQRTRPRQVEPDAWKHTGSVDETVVEQPTPTSLAQRLEMLPDEVRWAIQDFSIEDDEGQDDGAKAAEMIRQGQAIAVSDGSFKDGWGTSALCITGRQADCSYRLSGRNVVPGWDSDQEAYRSEAAGLYGIVSLLEALCEHHNVTAGYIEVGCDGRSAIRNSLDLTKWVDSGAAHYDLIMATRAKVRKSPISFGFRHIAGHQDTKNPQRRLNRWEQLNVEMDEIAGEYRLQTMNNREQFRYIGEIQDSLGSICSWQEGCFSPE